MTILEVTLDSDVPLYQQIRDRVVEAIANGRLTVGEPLPSTRHLASDLGINFHTVNKAYEVLRGEGLIRLNRKSGAVVVRDPSCGPPTPEFTAAWSSRAQTLLAEAIAQGMPHDEVALHCQRITSIFRRNP